MSVPKGLVAQLPKRLAARLALLVAAAALFPFVVLALQAGLAGGGSAGAGALGAVFLAGLAATGAAYLALRQVLAPLAPLTEALESLADRTLVPVLAEDGEDELGRMARAVNHLIRGMERRIELATATADIDDLTGALNPGGFGRLAGEVMTGAMLYLDVDRLDALNKRFGRPAGDLVLRECARVIAVTIRDDDVFGRMSGEEFAVCLKGAPEQAACKVAERIRADVETRLRVKGQAVTVSVGVAATEAEEAPDALVERAMAGMRYAKEQGGNRVDVAPVTGGGDASSGSGGAADAA